MTCRPSHRGPATNLNSRGRRASLAAGAAVLVLVTAFCALAWASRDAPESVDRSFPYPGGAWGGWYLPVVLLAVAGYVAGVVLVRRAPPSRRAAAVLAVAIQLAPLAAPLLLSSDAWSYWMYGRIAAVHGESPYEHPPEAFPDDPALPWTGPDWRDQTSIYGPAFTLASDPVARLAGESEDAAAWLYKALAAGAMLTAALLAARLAARKELALALAGWNPVLALHAAGGGHNDAWLGALVLAALALAASNRRRLAGAAWALAVLVKWVPLVFLVLRALEARRTGRRVSHLGFAVVFVATAGLATVLWGLSWLGAFGPIAENVDQATSYALPERLGLPGWIGVAAFALAFAWLARQAWHGRARLGLAAGLLLVTTPYLTPWYLAWAVPLAAAEEDRTARVLAVALTVYLAPQTIPT